MKKKQKIKVFAFVFLMLNLSMYLVRAQVPSQFKYQAVVRDVSGNVVANQAKSIVIDILKGSTSGSIIFTETHNVTTSPQGVINLNIGSVNSSGLSQIDWSSGLFFIKISIDGLEIGTSQLLSVPYALYASKAGNSFSGDYADLRNKPTLFDGDYKKMNHTPNFVDSISKYSFSGDYADLKNKPTLFDGDYRKMTNAPNIVDTIGKYGFSGSYSDLTNKPTGVNQGDIQYWNGNTWTVLPIGQVGQVLTVGASGQLVWANNSLLFPTMKSIKTTDVQLNSAILSAEVNPNGSLTTLTFEYGNTNSYGNTVTATPSTVTGSLPTGISINLPRLLANTVYHYRLKATNAAGVTMSNDLTFSTLDPNNTFGTIVDIEGNSYKTVKIGTQTWMAENLKSTKFNDGTQIQLKANNPTPSYNWASDNEANKVTYGAIYNWYVTDLASNGNKNVCPTGWHVATFSDIDLLKQFLGDPNTIGDKLKESGISHWPSPNASATNETGFTAIPFGPSQTGANWWLSSAAMNSTGIIYYLMSIHSHLEYGMPGIDAFYSIRCVQDSQ